MAIPKTLIDRLHAGKVIPFIGTGVSMSVRNKDTGEPIFPSWKKVLFDAADRLDSEGKAPDAKLVRSLLEIDPADYFDAAKRARNALGTCWFDFLKAEFDHPRECVADESLSLAKAVWKLGSNLIITTNYDRVLKWACPQSDDLRYWDIEAPVEQAAALRDGVKHPTIWHLHGQIDNAANIILTPDGYSRLYPNESSESRFKAAIETLRKYLTTHTLLFIGFSLDDTAFGVQLKGINEIYEGATGPHYVLVRETEKDRVKALGYPVEIITYTDYGAPLLKLLQELSSFTLSVKPPSTTIESMTLKTEVTATSTTYDPRNRPFFVPFRPKGEQVIGRETAIESVRKQLTCGRRTAIGQTASFQGLGGLGKTQLAVEYAYRYKGDYPDGVIWLNADQDIDAQLIELADKACWIAPQSEHKDKLAVAIQRLRSYSDSLIIFDNVEDVEDIKAYLPEPTAEPHILVTSRIDQPDFTPIPIDPLDEELSIKLLLQESGRKPESDSEWHAAREIAKALGGLPLALELAGAYLAHRSTVGWQQYHELLEKNLKAALPGKLSSFTRHEADLYSTLRINEEILNEEPRLRQILDLLTWSGAAPMGLSLMCALLDVHEKTALTNALGLGSALRLLQKAPDRERYTLHRLVREVRREDAPITNRLNWVNEVCRRIGDWFQYHRRDFIDLPRFEAEIDHLRSWQENAFNYAPEHASRLAWLQGYPPFHRGSYQEAKEQLEKALDLFAKTREKDREMEAHLRNDLSVIYSDLGNYPKGLIYANKALELRLSLFGEKHADTAMSFHNVGGNYKSIGKYGVALKYAEKALSIWNDLFGEQHSDTARGLDAVGNVYLAMGDNSSALDYAQKALTIRLKLYGERHPDTAQSFNNVGTAYSAIGEPSEALKYSEKALAIQKDLYGERHPDVAHSLNNVSNNFGKLGKPVVALEYMEKALKLYRDILGEQHPATITSVDNLACILSDLDRKQEALKLLEEFLHKITKDHPSSAISG